MTPGLSRLDNCSIIDRTNPINFVFDGRPYQGYVGDTLASALIANGVKIVGRSFKYHRPRGINGYGAEETNALVGIRLGHRKEPNIPATQIEIFEGLVAESQNRWPSLENDFGYINKPTNELTIEDKNKNKLKLSYDIDNLNYLWIFQSQGGWMGHNVVVIEPCTNGRKSLKAAVSQNMSIKGPINFETNYSVELS